MKDFLAGYFEANEFEKAFTKVYDLEDLNLGESAMNYLQQVRQLLERYSFSPSDLQNFPAYYISDKQLMESVASLKDCDNQ